MPNMRKRGARHGTRHVLTSPSSGRGFLVGCDKRLTGTPARDHKDTTVNGTGVSTRETRDSSLDASKLHNCCVAGNVLPTLSDIFPRCMKIYRNDG